MGHGDDDEPEEFADPITLAIMEEAMMAPCGHSFSRASITTWLRQNHNTCPVCKKTLAEGQLVPNYALRSAIERYQARRPGAKDDGEQIEQPQQQTNHYASDAYFPPDPVKSPPPVYTGTSSSTQYASAPPEIDLDADTVQHQPAGGDQAQGGGDEEMGWCMSLTKDAREADQGCCICECDGPVYCCDQAHKCEAGTVCKPAYPWWISPSKELWVWLYGTNSTYTRRTITSVCIAPFLLLWLVLATLELTLLMVFWVVAVLVISPLWVIIRIPIVMFFPLQYENSIKPSCWDKTFGCQ